MAIRITAAHEVPAIEFEIAVKGRKTPFTFAVPKLQYLAPEKHEEYKNWLSSDLDATKLSAYQVERASTLKLLEVAGVSVAALATLEKLTAGELREISKVWSEQSKVSLGESEPSAAS